MGLNLNLIEPCNKSKWILKWFTKIFNLIIKIGSKNTIKKLTLSLKEKKFEFLSLEFKIYISVLKGTSEAHCLSFAPAREVKLWDIYSQLNFIRTFEHSNIRTNKSRSQERGIAHLVVANLVVAHLVVANLYGSGTIDLM